MTISISNDQRQQILFQQVSIYLNQGWEVQSQNEFSVILVKKPKPVNHILHLLLSILTAGVWLFVWLGLAMFSSSKSMTKMINVSENGAVISN